MKDPLFSGSIGMTEKQAREEFGDSNIKVTHFLTKDVWTTNLGRLKMLEQLCKALKRSSFFAQH